MLTLAAVALLAAGLLRHPAAAAPARPRPVGLAPVLSLAGNASPLGGSQIGWAHPLNLLVTHATLVSVVATDGDGDAVEGSLLGPTSWRSYTPELLPATTYRLVAVLTTTDGRRRTEQIQASTPAAAHYLHATVSPSDDAVVGVGLPVIVTLDRPVTDPMARSVVQARLAVRSTPAVAGAWRWMSPTELHYRGAQFWAAGTHLVVTADLSRLELPDGTWGAQTHTSSYTIGHAFTSTVDNATHLMTSSVDGTVVRVMKDSLGRPGYDTHGGVHLVLEKQASLVMDSATTGHAVGDVDYYKETVLWTVRLSYGGTFVHSAPWSVADQGVRNVSHGCINLSPADAQWFFGQARRGDIVTVINATIGPVLHDPGMSDWNIAFADWANA